MDIEVKQKNDLEISVLKTPTSVQAVGQEDIGVTLKRDVVNMTVEKSDGIVFEFVQRVVAGANVVRCTYAEFVSMQSLDSKTWYAVTTTSDELRYLYLGNTLIAKASDDGGTWGFAYTFPIIFGR